MAQIIATVATIKAKATELRQQNKALKQQIDQLESLASSLNGQWEGDAKDKFQKTFQKDKTQMTNFYNAIEQYCQKLDEIAKAYETVESKNVNQVHTH